MVRFSILNFLLAVALFGAVEAGVAQAWFYRPTFAQEILIFLTVTHLVLYSVIIRQINKRPENFVMVYLGSTVLRILFFGIFIFTILWLDPPGGSQNALLFLISYFLFTGLEVLALYLAVRGQKPTNLGQKEG